MSESHVFSWVATHIPLAALVVKSTPANRPMITKLTEQAIVGIVSAGVAMYANDIRQQDKIDAMNLSIQKLERSIEQMRNDLYTPIAKNNR